MFESIGEVVVLSVVLGVTVFTFLYLAYRGSHGRRRSLGTTEDGRGDPQGGGKPADF